MIHTRMAFVVAIGCALLLLMPGGAAAQSVIAGSVRDATGGGLPGGTVEGSSPALLEKVRTPPPHEAGQFLIVGLPPPGYAATFNRARFSPGAREETVSTP